MANEYRLTVELTKSEIAGYNFNHIRWLLLLDLIGLIILMTGVYISVTSPNPEARETLGVLVIWGALLLAVGFSQPFILFLQIFILKSPAVAEQMLPKFYLFDDSGIHIQVNSRTALRKWSEVRAIKEVGKLLLIYTSPKLAYVIPFRYFESRKSRERFVEDIIKRINSIK
jgi:hypothetical protein